jgi:hypothetical protein
LLARKAAPRWQPLPPLGTPGSQRRALVIGSRLTHVNAGRSACGLNAPSIRAETFMDRTGLPFLVFDCLADRTLGCDAPRCVCALTRSIWPLIRSRLLEYIRAVHRSDGCKHLARIALRVHTSLRLWRAAQQGGQHDVSSSTGA